VAGIRSATRLGTRAPEGLAGKETKTERTFQLGNDSTPFPEQSIRYNRDDKRPQGCACHGKVNNLLYPRVLQERWNGRCSRGNAVPVGFCQSIEHRSTIPVPLIVSASGLLRSALTHFTSETRNSSFNSSFTLTVPPAILSDPAREWGHFVSVGSMSAPWCIANVSAVRSGRNGRLEPYQRV
jgi:hypothetical protein